MLVSFRLRRSFMNDTAACRPVTARNASAPTGILQSILMIARDDDRPTEDMRRGTPT